jgi:hypothetical protein
VQRDSIFVKIQRGKIDAEKVIVLKKSLSGAGNFVCQSYTVKGYESR